MSPDQTSRRCTVYRSHDRYDTFTMPALGAAKDPEVAVSLRAIMARELICVRADLEVAHVTSLMVTHHIGCLPVVDEKRHPIGIITKSDLAEQLNASMRKKSHESTWAGPAAAPRVAEDLMMPVMFSLQETASVADAAKLMVLEDTHHVLVLDANHVLVGIVSAKDIVGWVAKCASAEGPQGPPRDWRPCD
jgi:CBS domain-containing membrane protein